MFFSLFHQQIVKTLISTNSPKVFDTAYICFTRALKLMYPYFTSLVLWSWEQFCLSNYTKIKSLDQTVLTNEVYSSILIKTSLPFKSCIHLFLESTSTEKWHYNTQLKYFPVNQISINKYGKTNCRALTKGYSILIELYIFIQHDSIGLNSYI